MNQRSLRYTDGKSDKFWTIALSGASHTVTFGRYGTAGQTQTKEFPTAAAALKSYEKLVVEKLKKGYVEAEAIATPAPAVMSITTPQAVEPHPVVAKSTPVGLKLERLLNLNPADWFWATWRNLPPLQLPAAKPFDLQQAQAQLAQVKTKIYGWAWDWSKADIPRVMSREEAHFWLSAMLQTNNQITPQQLSAQLATQSFTGDISFEDFCRKLFHPANSSTTHSRRIDLHLSAELCLPLLNLFPTVNFIDLLFLTEQQMPGLSRDEVWDCKSLQKHLTQGFQRYLLPYLSSAEIGELRHQVEQQLDLSQWPMDYYEAPSPTFYLAAYLGCPSLRLLVESWEDDRYHQSGWRHDYYHRPQDIVLGLANAELVQLHMRRLKLSLQFPEQQLTTTTYLRGWLAHSEFSALDYVGNTILGITNKEDAEVWLREFASCVRAPEAAPIMLEAMLSSKAPQVARQWLQENPAQTIAGLIPIAVGRGKMAEAAIEFLHTMKRKGHGSFIQTCLEQEPAEIAAKIRATVLDVVEKVYIPYDEQTTPPWLQQAVATLATKSSKKSSWAVMPGDLPPIAVGDHCLNEIQVNAVFQGLRQSKLDSPQALVVAVKNHADPAELDLFAWKLFEAWLTEGALAKENWAMIAVGLWGTDISALKLAPLVRVWPGESQHPRAVLGLECLRSIGTDTALMQINGIAQKVKFKGIKERAQACMEAIAQERGMTREQLEDRIVPDCDLDERGTRIFDFGARQFRFALGLDLKPLVKDGDGKVKPDLPKPNVKDDPEKAAAALGHWKLLKKQVSEVIKIQPGRLEQAMITGRRWPVADFENLLVKHPLMTHLVQRLIWGGYDAAGNLVMTLRVTEDQTYADAHDETLVLTAIDRVGIVHPLHLSEQQRSPWGEILSDYDIMSPFPQLGRAIYQLAAGEETLQDITRFKDAKVPAVTLVGMLEKAGWLRGIPQDGGVYHEHSKPFYGANVTAVVEYDGVPVGYMDGWDEQSIDSCFFLPGIYTPEMYPNHQHAIALGDVDAVAISEVLKDLTAIAAKAP